MKKIAIYIMILALAFSVVGCKKEFDYEKEMDQAMELMQNSTKMHAVTEISFDENFAEKVNGLSDIDTDSEAINPEEIQKVSSTLNKLGITFEQKVDLDAFIIDFSARIQYDGEDFINGRMFMNDGFMFVNENNLLKKGALLKFDFITDMMAQMAPTEGEEPVDFIGIIKEQVVQQQDMSKDIMPILDRIMDENIEEPEVLETEIAYNGSNIDTNEVRYSMTYVEALELAKIFLQDEAFMTAYEGIMESQTEYMSSLSGGMPMQSTEEMMTEFRAGVDEAIVAIDEILADEEAVQVLNQYNIVVSYYFDDGIKSIAYDLDFMTIKNDYMAINEEVTFDTPTEESSYVIEDQMGLFGITSILNQEAIEGLQNHPLVTDLNELGSTPEE